MKKRVWLTERDKRLLKKLDSYSLLTTKQILQSEFVGVRNTTALRRLRILESRRYIKRHSGLRNGLNVWTLGTNGLKVLMSSTVVNLNKNTLEHDVAVTQVRQRLDALGAGENWKMGHQLRAATNKGVQPLHRTEDTIPDGLFTISTKHGPKVVFLEVELVPKAKCRYERILELYASKRSISIVWYVVSSERLGKLIVEEVQRTKAFTYGERVLWTKLEDLFQSPEKILLNGNGRSIRLVDFCQLQNSGGSKSTEPEVLTPVLKP